MADRSRLPTLSNAAQLEIMALVKGGMSVDEAMKRATEIAAKESQAPVRKGVVMLFVLVFFEKFLNPHQQTLLRRRRRRPSRRRLPPSRSPRLLRPLLL